MCFKLFFFQNHDGFLLIDSLFHLEALGSDDVFCFVLKHSIAIAMSSPNRKFEEYTVLFKNQNKAKIQLEERERAYYPWCAEMLSLGTAEDGWCLFSSPH